MFEAIIQGRLGKDPEMRYTPNGTAVLNFSIAHNWQYKDQNITKWVNGTIWADLAEEVNGKFAKGDLVLTKGPITFRTWHRDRRGCGGGSRVAGRQHRKGRAD